MRAVIVQPWISYRGAETVSVLQAYYLKKNGHRASLICCFLDSLLPPHTRQTRLILPANWIQRLFKSHRLIFYIFSIPTLSWLLATSRHKYDIIIAHNYPSLWVSVLVGKIFAKKVVWYVHGVSPHSGFPRNVISEFLWKVLFNHIDMWSAKSCDGIVVVSRKIQKEVRTRYGISSEVLYPPVDVALFNAKTRNSALRQKLEIPTNASIMMQVSSATKEKRADITLKCFFDLRSKGMDVYLVFVGANPKSVLFEEIVPEPLHEFIRVISYVPASDLRAYYQLSDVVSAPSKIAEGCSVVPLQALLSGTESVVVRGSGVDEILTQTLSGEISTGSLKDFSKRVESVIKRSRKQKYKTKMGFKSAEKKVKLIVYPEVHIKKLILLADKIYER